MNSKHSIERSRERFGLNEDRANRFIAKALERGKTSGEMPKKERAYMEAREAARGCKTVFYNGAFFIFGLNDVCITVFEAPAWFCRKQYFDGKERIRDAKKYQRYSLPDAA